MWMAIQTRIFQEMFDMHRNLKFVLVAMTLSIFWHSPGMATEPQGSFSASSEAKKLAAIEKDYFHKRLNNDWKGIYQHQNPRFKAKVSVERSWNTLKVVW
jgi:hypothetical protein